MDHRVTGTVEHVPLGGLGASIQPGQDRAREKAQQWR